MEASVGRWQAERWPELEASLFYEEEEADEITGGGLAITLPLFDRKKGEIARARAEAREAETMLHAAELQARAEVARAEAALARAEQVLALYDAEVLDAARENVSLMEDSYREGKVRLSEVLVLRQTLVEAEEQYLEARFERAVATVDLLTAVGLPLVEEGAGR